MIAAQAPDSLRAMHRAFVGRLEGFAKVCFPSSSGNWSRLSGLVGLGGDNDGMG
jgi:hypothetical protein